MQKPGKNGKSQSVMMYGNDVAALDKLLAKGGYISQPVYDMMNEDPVFRSLIVKARKEALHDIIDQAMSYKVRLRDEIPMVVLWEDGENKNWRLAETAEQLQDILCMLEEKGIDDKKVYLQTPSIEMAIRHEESEEEKKEEKEEKSFYILERRTCEILGSGSDIQEVATTKSLEEALEILKKGYANHLTKYTRKDGRLVTQYWDSYEQKFV